MASINAIDGLEVVTSCEQHHFVWFRRPGARVPRGCPACARGISDRGKPTAGLQSRSLQAKQRRRRTSEQKFNELVTERGGRDDG